ncbi:Phosphate acyltransferase [Candidatus Bealeia paramacronuclearis]|uniref:Phosphate acyltransferase n=1 Tax=Candidatus Bealeia paramacronuclearis TaxID=1921001 RepID=A0ABZ2C4H8_9PROT|nr:Phosphate acyltransferase [Candidatus Bealeia paramacronuclearis]
MGVTLAVDGMGGDQAPQMVVDGLALASIRYPTTSFILFGDEKTLSALVALHSHLKDHVTIVHTDEVVTSEMKPSAAIRGLPQSSMRLAIKAVAEGKAQGVVSAGNTGAYMALAKMVLKTLPGIERPALASLVPTLKSESVMLDLGANVECNARNLEQFALMGVMFARYVLSLCKPKVGVLNVGSEEMKGHAYVKEAADLIRAGSIGSSFHGFIEGDDITKGTVDVIVTDGFTGNVVLKSGEGVMQLAMTYVREGFKNSIFASLGYFLARPMLEKLKSRLDHRRYNGGIWLGLNGVAIKSHGGTDALGFSHAIALAIDMVTSGVNEHIVAEFKSEEAHLKKKAAV